MSRNRFSIPTLTAALALAGTLAGIPSLARASDDGDVGTTEAIAITTAGRQYAFMNGVSSAKPAPEAPIRPTEPSEAIAGQENAPVVK